MPYSANVADEKGTHRSRINFMTSTAYKIKIIVLLSETSH
jgi:hypothetical protein